MNKRFLLLISFVLCMLGGVSAEDITISANSSTFAEETAGGDIVATSGDVEFRYAQAGSTSAIIGGLKDDQLRIYKSSTLTISSARSIQKIAITAVLNKQIGADGLTAEGYTAAADKLSGVWEGTANSVTLTASNGQCRITQIVVTLEDANVAVKTPTLSLAAGEYMGAQTLTISCATADAKIYYTLDGTEPSETATEYTAPIELTATTTVKAVAVKGADKSSVAEAKYVIVKKIANTQEAPYTVAEANALAKNTDAVSLKHANNKVYIKGIVTEITELSTQYGNATYTIADETGATETLSVYRGKYLNDTKFDDTNKDELTVGKEVVVYGNLSMYKEAPQVAQYNWLVSITTPVVPATPELKITSELKEGTDELGDSYKYLDFGTVEYGQTSSVSISFEGKNLPAKVTTYPDGITEEVVDNYITVHMNTYPFFDLELSEGGKAETIIDPWFGEEMTFYTFPIAADGSVKGSVTIKLKKEFNADPFDEEAGYGLPEGEAIAIGNVAFGDQSYAYVTDPVTLMLTLTKPNQGGEGSALENATIEAKAVKVIENGVVYIIKNGVKYTVTGVAVK